jgi:hypothetical protein
MADEVSRSQSHLFTVRVWREELGAGRVEWRGKVQHALSGEARYFREWAELVAFMGEQAGDVQQGSDIKSLDDNESVAR